MTLKSRLMSALAIALVLFAMAPSSFAQVSLTLTPNPSTSEVQTNKNAQTASPGTAGGGILITGQLIATSPLSTTTLRVSFPSPITSSPASCTDGDTVVACADGAIPSTGSDFVRIEGATGVFASVSNPVLNTASSRIEITLPGTVGSGGTNPNDQSGSFRLVGVRIDANGKTGAQNITVALSSSANNYLLQTTSATVISAIADGIGSVSIGARPGGTSEGSATIFTNRTAPDKKASLAIVEGFASAFRTATQSSNSGQAVNNSSRLRLTFSNVPSGVTLTLSINSIATNLNGVFVGTGTVNQQITSASSVATIEITKSSLTTVETMEVDVTDVTLTSTAAVTTAGAITVTASLIPNGDAVRDNGSPTDDSGYPVFAEKEVGPVTLVNITAASTTILIPLAEKIGAFDTGISVANTTADPFGGTSGGGAAAAAGTLKFDFFPSSATGAATACTVTTSSTNRPGFGIASDGTIPAGATYLVLLSQLLPVSNCAAGDFVGYIFITANFLNAHAAATISDFRTYSLAAPAMVLPPPATTPRSSPTTGVESLGF
jgi:hypothetical protein